MVFLRPGTPPGVSGDHAASFTLLITLGPSELPDCSHSHTELSRKQEASHFISLTDMGTRELNSPSRPQDVLQQIGSGPWVINSPVGLYSVLNMEEADCSWGSPGPEAPQGWPISYTQHRARRRALWALGTFPTGSWLIAPCKALSRQGQPPNRCFLIYLYSPGSPVLINYHLHSTIKRESCLGEGEGIHGEIQSRSSGCAACCWQQPFFPG